MPSNADATTLASLIRAHAPYDGMFGLRLPALANPSACIIAGGAKTVMIGEDVYECARGHVAVYSIDLPIASQVSRASHADPYLALKIDLDPARITELAAKVFPHGAAPPKETRALYVGEADAHMIEGRRVGYVIQRLRDQGHAATETTAA